MNGFGTARASALVRMRASILVVGAPILAIGLTRWVGWEVRELRLAALVWMLLAAWWLTRVVLDPPAVAWNTPRPGLQALAGEDRRQAAYLRLLEGHLTSTAVDSGLQDTLRRLVRRRLAARGVEWEPGRPREEGVAPVPSEVPPELVAALTEPPRRWRPSEIDILLTRIEDL